MAGHRGGRLHRLAPGRAPARARPGGSGPGQFLHRQAREPGARAPRRGRGALGEAALRRGRHPCARHLQRRVRVRRRGAAPGRARQRAALDRQAAAHPRQQRERVPEHPACRARRRRRTPGVRELQRRLRRPSRAAEGRVAARARDVALWPVQAHERALRRRVCRLLRLPERRAALLQRLRTAAGSRRPLCLGDSGLARRAARLPT
jgi:hypothetical protein